MTAPSLALSSRLQALHGQLVATIPCLPDTHQQRQALAGESLDEVLHIWAAWQWRCVRPAARQVLVRDDFWTGQALAHRAAILALCEKIQSGADLSPYLSDRVRTHGYVAPGAAGRRRAPRGIDWKAMDFVANRYGVHHLHLSPGGSQALVFVEFSRDRACLLMLGDHGSFHDGSVEDCVARWRTLNDVGVIKGGPQAPPAKPAQERTRLALHGLNTVAQVDGKWLYGGMVSATGASVDVLRFADHLAETLEEDDAALEAGRWRRLVPAAYRAKVTAPRWRWALHYGDLILIDDDSRLGFPRVHGPT